MEYTELKIRIAYGDGKAYAVTAELPDGGATQPSTLVPPFTLAELSSILRGVAQTVRGDASTTREGRDEELDEPAVTDTPQSAGQKLFAALFQPEIFRLYLLALGSIRGKPDMGLRVRIIVGSGDPRLSEVASMPWEILAEALSTRPLALSGNHVLVRSLDVGEAVPPLDIPKPLRILLVMSNPRDSAALDLAKEEMAIAARWQGAFDTELVVAQPTMKDITFKLASKSFHVLHYMGHGTFDQKAGRGGLVLEDADGNADVVSAATFASCVTGRGLRLVFLNACKTGTAAARAGADPFGGVAAALIEANIPAVVANQFPISDSAAIEFADTFYAHIVRGMPVDAAVSEGRLSLLRDTNSEWATPVLYMRSKDGSLLRITQPADDGATTPNAPRRFRVFLGAMSARLQESRAMLVAALEAAGMEVTSSDPLAGATEDWSLYAHDARVRALVGRADLCVHLLDTDPGTPINGSGAESASSGVPDTFPVRQLVIGAQSARSQLLVYDTSMDFKAIVDRDYAEWFASQKMRAHDGVRFQVASVSAPRVKDTILQRCMELGAGRLAAASVAPAAPVSAGVTSVYVDMHPMDAEATVPLTTELLRRGIAYAAGGAASIAGDTSPGALLSFAEEQLARVQLVILVFGQVSSERTERRLQWLEKFIGRRKLKTPIVIYLTSPKTEDEMAFNFRPYDVIDASAGLDAAQLAAVLERA